MGPVVAGSFYPADPDVLASDIERLLAEADPPSIGELRGLVVPHAGYVYSGPVAATAYALLEPDRWRRVVLIGPSHFHPYRGLAVPMAEAWVTPVGTFPIAGAGLPRLQDAFATEHCLEVQLPFLHATIGALPIVPILTGELTPQVAADTLGELVGDDDLLIVSTDLSHYLPYEEASRRDAMTARAVVEGKPLTLAQETACGRTGLQAALLLAAERSWSTALLDLRSSGDTAGDRSRVVGYGAFAMEAA